MAKFLTTKQISSQLEELIQEADKTLYLVCPYLKLSNEFQELINSRNNKEKKTIIIYGKKELNLEQLKFLTGLRHVYLKFHEDLHAKCYLNDSKLIITSLNFYEYSINHNKEIGVLFDITNPGDKEIFSKALEHIKFIEENSDDKPFELNSSNSMQGGKVEKPDESKQHKTPGVKKDKETKFTKKKLDEPTGYCIRTGVEIPFNVEKPMSNEAFKVWSQFGDPDYPEKFCHFSGEPSNGETSVSKTHNEEKLEESKRDI